MTANNSHAQVLAADSHEPKAHAASHQNGGSDEIDVTGLTGAGGGGLTRSTLGTTTVGGSWRSPTGTSYAKKITLPSDGLVASIVVHVKGDGANAGALGWAIWSDSAGAPTNLLAQASAGFAQAGSPNTAFLMGAAARWFTMPVGAWLAAGDYWIGATLATPTTGGIQIAYAAGTGSDRTQGNSRPGDASFLGALTTTTDDHSIYANVLS